MKIVYRKGDKKQSARAVAKCDDCNGRLEIYYDYDMPKDDVYEIGGVLATREEWRKLFKKVGLI